MGAIARLEIADLKGGIMFLSHLPQDLVDVGMHDLEAVPRDFAYARDG